MWLSGVVCFSRKWFCWMSVCGSVVWFLILSCVLFRNWVVFVVLCCGRSWCVCMSFCVLCCSVFYFFESLVSFCFFFDFLFLRYCGL